MGDNSRAVRTVDGILNMLADAEADQYLVVAQGSDADHWAYPSAITDVPEAIVINGCDNAEDELAGEMLGRGETKIVKLEGTGSRRDPLYALIDGSGKASKIPTTPGAYWYIGDALEDGVDEQEIGIDDKQPRLVGAWDPDNRQFALPAFAADPTTPIESLVWYNTTENAVKANVNGSAETIATL